MTGIQTAYWLVNPYAENRQMPTILLSLISPERLLFEEQVDQVDLPGAEGDLGVLSGHAPIVTALRPGIVTASTGAVRETFVVLGGVAEFSNDSLTILAEFGAHIDDFDAAELEARIAEMEEALEGMPAGEDLDRIIVRLDQYKSIQTNLIQTTAF